MQRKNMMTLHMLHQFTFHHAQHLRTFNRRGETMGMVASAYYTAEMVRALPEDGNRYETVHGELLVTPAPSAWHQELIGRLYQLLKSYVQRNTTGHPFLSPADISWSDDTLVQPDLFVVNREQVIGWDWSKMKDLLLAIEVLSPSSTRHDRLTKRRLYQEVGIPEYWIIDPQTKTLEVFKPGDRFPTLCRVQYVWQPSGPAPGLQLNLEQLFDLQVG